MLPSVFISHGSPMILLEDCPARDFLRTFHTTLPRKPRAIAMVTAHWMTRTPATGADPAPKMIYDFGRFDDRLFQQHYNAPGDPAIAAEIGQMFTSAGLQAAIDPHRGYDHGVWIPLMLMYPDADIPVIPVAVQPNDSPAHHYAMGQAMAKLRERDILVLGSGSFTHDLHRVFRQEVLHEPPHDVIAFSEWMDEKLTAGAVDELLDYRAQAPFAVENHPTDEHLLPIFTAMGAAGPGAKATRLHASTTYGVLRMDAYAFGAT
jgi:4,5-DOPA dioxygenase extradiol